MKKRRTVLLTGTVALIGVLQVDAADLVYVEEDGGGGGPRGLYDFDSKTGISSLRAGLDAGPRFFSLAMRPSDGTVFGADPIPDTIYTVDIDTGDFALTAATGLDNIADITFHPVTGEMYGLERNSSLMFIIDPDDGSSVFVGNATPARAGLTFAPDGTLYAFEVFGGDLYTIDPSDASATFVGGSGDPISLIEDADFTPDGELFITDFSGLILQVDPETGARTNVGNSGSGNGLVGILGQLSPPVQCPWDLDGDGSVGVGDLLILLAAWGPCKGCPADFDDNGNVGVSDLLALLANWGPCP